VKGAYLNGLLKEKIYMKQPEGYGDGTPRVCQLIKPCTASNKPAGNGIANSMKTAKTQIHPTQIQTPCVYIWRTEDDFIIITVWVDDMLLFTTTFELKKEAIKDIEDEWEITDLGTPTKIVAS